MKADYIRIYADVTNVDLYPNSSIAEKKYIKDNLIKVAVKFFERRIKVNRREYPILVTSDVCDNYIASPVIPNDHVKNGVQNSDFVIYVNLVNN